MYGLLLCLFRSVAALHPFRLTSKLEGFLGGQLQQTPISSSPELVLLSCTQSHQTLVVCSGKRMSMSTRLSFLTSHLSSQRVCAEFLWASIVTSISFDVGDYVCGFIHHRPRNGVMVI